MKCLNCGYDFGDVSERKYCDILCRVAFGQKQINEFNKTYKPKLDYYEVEKK